ncbi:MAG: ATP-dependent DNA helicase RecQ [Flavobacteriales bacterium]
MNKENIHKALKQHWGYDTFRPKQEEIINSILEKKDALALLPTGGGKSLCYQIPAIISEGICIVISPLVALMKDQVSQLKKRNIKAIALTGGMRPSDLDIALDNCVYGNIKLLYLSPERLQSEIVLTRIQKMKISLIAVDEAHCISQWGYDFRPSYLKIAEIRELLPNAPVLALTATATKVVAIDIQKKLLFKKSLLIQNSFNRSNLAYMVLEENHKMDRLEKMLTRIKGSAIIYVRSRKRAYELSTELNHIGIKSLYYHAGLPSSERSANQDKWMNNSVRVMVATNAFGMGIDKPDVRLVVHLQSPNTLEAYFQEAGRAGRDGEKSFAVSLFQKSDLETSLNRFEENYPNSKEVRDIYQKLANFLQVAIGDGYETNYEFSIDEFCEQHKLSKEKCLKSFHILEKEKHLKFDSYNNQLSTIQISASPNAVVNYQTNSTKKSELLQLLLRVYPNIFDEPAEINERKLAIQIGKDSNYIHKVLSQLNQEEILHYTARTNRGRIVYLSARHSSNNLPLSKTHFEERKSLLVEKLKSMNQYISNTEICRSRILLDYFDEQTEHNCGICDVCIAHNTNTEDFKKTIREDLLKRVTIKPIFISTFVAQYSKLKELVIIDEIKALLEESILIKEGDKIKLNEQR